MKQFSFSCFQPASLGRRLTWVLGLLLLLTGSHGAWAQLSGAYTINSAVATGARNYASFTDAVAQLNTVGVSGPVTFAVSGGPYTEQVVLNAITGTSAANTVTFNGGNSTIQSSAATAAQRAVVQFNGATWVVINNLNINASGGTYGWGVLITNASDNDAIKNCTITTDVTSTSTNYSGIVVSGSATAATTAGNAANNLTLQGNTVIGGYYGITLVGASATSLATGNKVIGNNVREFYFYGIYTTFQANAQFVSNDVSRPTRTAISSFYGIYLASGASKVAIEKNRFHDMGTGSPSSANFLYGIYINSADGTAGNEIDVVNNVIYNITGTSGIYALYNIGSDYVRYYNNTLSLDDAGTNTASATYAFYQTTLATGIELKNNIISVTRNSAGTGAKYALYFSTATSTIASDYNDLYVGTGSNFYTGYASATSYATLANWQAATGNDLHSVQASPGFVAPAAGNLQPTSTPPNNSGTPLARVTDDITGATRSATPDMGAYEFTPAQNDAAVTSITNFAPYLAGPRSVVVNVLNNGQVTLNTLTLTYTLNGGAPVSQSFTNLNIATGQTGQLTLTGINFPTGQNTLVVTSSLPNGVADPNPANDSQTLTNRTALSGAYTINSGGTTSGTNFASFTDAATALNLGGVLGAVTFAVSGGPYTEQLVLTEAPGASATNTVTFNGGGSTIRFASNNSAQRAVITLDGADYYTFNNLNIDATGGTGTSGTYGWGVLLTNAANNNSIKNCTITADGTQASTFYQPVVVSGSATSSTTSGDAANNFTLQGCTLTGGYYSLTLIGTSAASLATGNRILNNTVRDFYLYGIYTGYQGNAQFIGNDISRPTRATISSFYGIYLFSGASKVAIEKNRLHDMGTGSPTSANFLYGIYISSADGTAGNEIDVVNNVIYNITGTSGIYALYNIGSDYVRYYNNTLSLDDAGTNTASATYAFYQTTLATGIELKNNIISVTRNSAGTGAKYALYFSTATSTIASDYNDLYVGTGSNFYTGYASATSYATLANWQAATSNDLHSVQVDPIFANAASGNFTPANVALNNSGTPLTRVTDDITGATRGAVPDIGAYEFTPVATDLAAQALLNPTAGAGCYSPTQVITVQVRNAGTATLNFATNPATVTAVVTLPGGTTQTLTGTVTTGTLASGATQSVTLTGTFDMAPLGTYSFAVTATVTGDQNASNNALAPTPSITVAVPVAGTASPSSTQICQSGTATLTLTGAANGNIQWQSSSSATGTFTDIAGATSATYTTPVITTTTYYRAQVRCNTNTATSNVSTITVNTPVVASTNSPIAVCQGSTATLTATSATGTNIRFFSTATGGTALTGTTTTGATTSVTTPAITAATTYYAEAYTGGQENVGKALTNGADGTNTIGGLYFTTTGPVMISNVTVYRTANAAAGTATIYLLTGSTTSTTGALATIVAPVPANTTAAVSPTVLTLNFAVPAAGSYTLYLGAATPSLIRDYLTATPAVAYPYTSPSGTVTITGPTLAPYYYFFYNWQIGSECTATPRTAIQVNLLPGTPSGFSYASTTYCQSSTSTPTPTVTGTSGGTFTVAPATGLTVNASTGALSLGTATPGTYIITYSVPASGGAACAGSSTATVTITAPQSAAFTYSGASFCAGSTGTVTPTLATGATAGTFSSTTGLSLNATTGVITLASSAAGTYVVTNTVAATSGCAAATATQTVTIGAAPTTPTLTSATTTICTGSSVTLTASAAAGVTYQFYLNGNAISGATSATYPATTAGSYTVVATNAGGCSATSAAVALTTATAPATPSVTSVGGTVICGNGTIVLTAPVVAGLTYQYLLNGTPISGATSTIYTATAAGSYTVVVTNAAGCTATSAATVLTASPTPATPTLVATGNPGGSGTVICGTGSLLLTSSAATGNQFYLNGVAIAGATGNTYSATAAGTYSVTVTNAGGCSATSALVTLTAAPTPTAPTLTATSQPSGAVLLTSSVATGNQFYLNGVAIAGATGQTYVVLSGTLSGSYTVTALSAAGCPSAPSTAVAVTVTGTAPAAPGTSLSVAPNPSTGAVTLWLTNVKVASTLTIVNALGQQVYAQALSAAAVQAPVALNVSGLASGVYLVRVTNTAGTLVQRLVRE